MLLGAFLVVGLSACSASVSVNNLDIDKLQNTIADGMQTQLDLPTAPSVTCPESVPIEAGNTFSCTAELDGESVEVKVTQNDDQGNVSWEVL